MVLDSEPIDGKERTYKVLLCSSLELLFCCMTNGRIWWGIISILLLAHEKQLPNGRNLPGERVLAKTSEMFMIAVGLCGGVCCR